MLNIEHLVLAMQTATGPVILISGIGLFLLTMTNRLGRVIDRARLLTASLPDARGEARAVIEKQLPILWKRSRLIRTAIMLVSLNALFVSVLIIVLFFSVLFELNSAIFIAILFVLSMAALFTALIFFIRDINKSLSAVKVELKQDILQ